jgi:hypothetical protein
VDGWMDGWVDGWESRVKDCLQQSKNPSFEKNAFHSVYHVKCQGQAIKSLFQMNFDRKKVDSKINMSNKVDK